MANLSSTAPESSDAHMTHPNVTDKPKVIGLYGVSGSGKTTLLQGFKQHLQEHDFIFFEGSDIVLPLEGGKDAFDDLPDDEKARLRGLAIRWLHDQSSQHGKTVIVTGHFSLWREDAQDTVEIMTAEDKKLCAHILYLDASADEVFYRRQNDQNRERAEISVAGLQGWIDMEKRKLREICYKNDTLFALIPTASASLPKTAGMIRQLHNASEATNLRWAELELEKVVDNQTQAILVFDADKTLAPQDTGKLFWNLISKLASGDDTSRSDPLEDIFDPNNMGYSHNAFYQASLVYEEAATRHDFDASCEEVASSVTLYPEMRSLLDIVKDNSHVGALVMSCGLRAVWELVLRKAGVSKKINVLGGGRHAEQMIMTGEVKGQLISCLQDVYKKYVWAFGDGPLDVDMLVKADQAVIVIGHEQIRSTSMDKILSDKLMQTDFQAHQLLLPRSVNPRLNQTILPLVEFNDDFLKKVSAAFVNAHATSSGAAKILMSATRDAAISGAQLREAHRRVGWYLAIELVTEAVGLETYRMQHVQPGKMTNGHRLKDENKTTIVALMRGGEPMALGVSDAFSLTRFVHAKEPDELLPTHLEGQSTLILVDSVINSGASIVNFVKHVRMLHPSLNIVVVAGVVQEEAVAPRGPLAMLPLHNSVTKGEGTFKVVAMRHSDNKFAGSGDTDIGNRLFNTQHMVKEEVAAVGIPTNFKGRGRGLSGGSSLMEGFLHRA